MCSLTCCPWGLCKIWATAATVSVLVICEAQSGRPCTMLAGVAGVAGVPGYTERITRLPCSDMLNTTVAVIRRANLNFNVLLLTGCSVVDRGSTAGHDGCDTGRRNPRCHIQQRLNDVTLENRILLPQIQDSHNLTLEFG